MQNGQTKWIVPEIDAGLSSGTEMHFGINNIRIECVRAVQLPTRLP